ncbi:DUF4835 family protein [Spongiivirga sp. MCCC 1A20706]|uniref:type IX secretion system protein PorD n=1 Tax=Spongiivirga sp. MCCC 1A20706 TaxID=3160963 RepID=UPI0039774549
MRKFLFVLFCVSVLFSTAQELNCKITVNSDKIGQTNQQIFKTLERSLNDFVNKTKWTNKQFARQEKINANMLINLSQFDGSSNFQASIQLQVSRPVYNSTYLTPIFFHKDNDFAFQYIEFQPLVFNPNNFESNLVSVISYYVYIVLGMDADTFAPNGGRQYYALAQNILNQAQQSGFKGWNQADGRRNRFWLSDNLQSNTFKEFHQVMYQYHRQGLDIMHEDPKKAKVKISNTFNILSLMNKRRPNSFLMQLFFDTKSDEILGIFSDGPQVSITRTVETLNKIAPFYASKWEDIKF